MAANKPFANLDRLSKLATPQPKLFDFKPTQGGEKVRVGFADNISLSKRNNQPGLGTTTALAQFYLSDQNTGFIKIKNQLPVEHKSSVIINKSIEALNQGSIVLPLSEFAPNQGAADIKSFSIDSLLRQGTTISNQVYSSFTINQDAKSITAIGRIQGTYTSNQITYSVVQTTPSIATEALSQGSVGINRILPSVNQGSVVISQAVDTPFIEVRQGIRKFNQKVTSDIEPATPTKTIITRVPYATLFKPVKEIPFLVPSSIVVINAKPANAFIDGRNPEIQTLGYLADRFGAQLLPSLRHGSQDPQNRGYITKNGSTPHSIVDAQSSLYNSVMLEEDGFFLDTINPAGINKVPQEVSGQDGGFVPGGAGSNNPKTTAKAKTVVRILSNRYYSNDDVLVQLAALSGDNQYIQHFTSVDNPNVTNRKESTILTVNGVTNPNVAIAQGLSGNEDEAVEIIRANVNIDAQKGPTYLKEKSTWTSPRNYTEIKKYTDIETIVKNKELNPTPTNVREHVVKVKSLAGGGTVTFTAFLTSFSDSHTANWTDINHVGQMDTFKVYKGATRQISVAFKVVGGYTGLFQNASGTAADVIAKLNSLINATVIGAVDGSYIKGPIVELTIAGLVNGIACAISSVKIDTEVAETGWDGQSGTPHVFSVSLDATALATKGGALLNNTATYLG